MVYEAYTCKKRIDNILSLQFIRNSIKYYNIFIRHQLYWRFIIYFALSRFLSFYRMISCRLQTFRPFFISLNLPYSVVRGEELVLQFLTKI
ncbi:hypothetical protein KUTeg_017292 [Tegillarca granosa]|uniref:Alpha-2-macroglobulin domain-containing protein n=1 Tax=Tegillarca granosa TaxID=220873 RepID=A0ABQ9ENH2_TEGGR|nr:hypothetical protein KUTeg_017292 [Tegillarca granosa]